MPAKVGERSVGSRHGGRAAGRQPIKAIGQIHRVRRSDDDQQIENKGQPAEAEDYGFLEERNVKFLRDLGQFRAIEEEHGENSSEDALKAELEAAVDALGAFLGDLEPVVVKADTAKE